VKAQRRNPERARDPACAQVGFAKGAPKGPRGGEQPPGSGAAVAGNGLGSTRRDA